MWQEVKEIKDLPGLHALDVPSIPPKGGPHLATREGLSGTLYAKGTAS